MAHYCFEVNGLSVDASYCTEDVQNVFLPLLKKWSTLQKEKGRRILVLMAGAPGSGKSTLSLFLQHLSEQEKDLVPVLALGMDGFHHDKHGYRSKLASKVLNTINRKTVVHIHIGMMVKDI